MKKFRSTSNIISQFQCTAYQTLIVNPLLKRLYAKKLLLVGPKLARHQQLALKYVHLESFVIMQIYVNMVSL